MVGTKLGSYEIREEVGKGGMALVYRAYQPNMDRDVAIKVILRSLDRDEEAVQRFQREARLIARLEHPHILPVYDFDGGHEPPYIVMRYLDGGTLKDVLKQGMLPLEEVSYLIRQVSLSLDYAHRQGIIHRDVKPSNILIDREGNAFVTDFGIARMVAGRGGEQITATGAIVGTPDYMAPEQVTGAAEVDHRVDIYALGAILFQMLTGELPYQADNPAGLLVQHLQAEIPSAVARNRELPGAVDGVIARCLAKEPDERYSSAVALADGVTAALGGVVSSRPARLRQAAGESVIMRRLGPETSETGSSSKTPSEQNKTVTALYASAAEFAEIIDEVRGIEAARQALNQLWETAADLMSGYGGVVVSQTEETLLAVWGAEVARENDAEQAIRAALVLQAAAQEQGDALLGEEEPLSLSIGLSTGLALIAPGETSGGFTASGMTVRAAQRLTQQAYGNLLITHDAYNQVRGVFTMEPDNPLRLRRGQEPVPTYRVLVAKPRAFRMNTRGVEGIETQMVGRDTELKSLQNAFLNAVEEEETMLVTVVAGAGLGKSRLLYEYSNWSELRPESFWLLRGRATPEMTRRPYALLRDLLSFRFEILDSDSPAIVRQKLEEGIEGQIGANREMAHLLGQLAGFDFSDSSYVKGLQGDPQQLTNRGKQLFMRWVAGLTDQFPVVMELEDLQHADDASLDLLTGLVSEYDELPLMLLGLARPALFDRRPAWGGGLPYHIRLELRPLDKWESRNLVREILKKVDRVPKRLRDLLVERAEGNPYYMEELVKMLIDDRVIVKDSDEVWRVEEERLGHLEVPATLTGLLQARLDSLLYPERLTLQRAAVVGRVFYDGALAALDAADETHLDDLPGILERLAERELIFVRETTALEGNAEYIFGGQMLRGVLLNTLLRSQQQTYYRAAAEWLVEVSGDRVDEYNSLIADYYERAGEIEAASRFLNRAGQRAVAISAYGEARDLFERALALTGSSDPATLPLKLGLGQACYYEGDYVTARRELTAAVNLATAGEQSEPQVAAEALYWLSRVATSEGNYAGAQAYLEESLPMARAAEDATALAHVLYGLGDLNWRLGESEQAKVNLEESLALARQLGNLNVELLALNRIATVSYDLGDLERGRDLYEETLARAEKVGNREIAGTALNNLGLVAYKEGDAQGAKEYAVRTLASARETGNQQFLSVSLNNLAEAYVLEEDRDAARALINEALETSLRIGAVPAVLVSIHLLGWMKATSGDMEHGLALLGFCLNHPSASSDNRRNFSEKLDYMGIDAQDPKIAAALEAGKQLELETVTAELQAELAGDTT